MAAEGGKLAGIKVLDLSLFLPGPMLTVMMADHGAEVVKVEPPTGDPVREMEPFENGHSVWFANLNRGKKSVVCDLKSEAGKAKLWDFIADADVFVEAFRPGVMNRLGFDYQAVSLRNPRIVYCSISPLVRKVSWLITLRMTWRCRRWLAFCQSMIVLMARLWCRACRLPIWQVG